MSQSVRDDFERADESAELALLNPAEEDTGAWAPEGMVTLRYLWVSVRRLAVVWIAAGLLGIVAGLTVPLVFAANGQASVTLLLTHPSNEDPIAAMTTDASLVTTRTVASRVVGDLGLRTSADDLLKEYSVTQVTDRVLEITVNATTDAEATRIAGSVATQFLAFRLQQLQAEQQPVLQQVDAARKKVKSLQDDAAAQGIDLAQADAPDPDASDETSKAITAITTAKARLSTLQQQAAELDAQVALVSSSRVLDPAAPVQRSTLGVFGLDAMAGLVAGLALGLGVVVIRAVLVDRVWSRQAVATAVGAPVAVSVGALGTEPPRLLAPVVRFSRGRPAEVATVVRHLRGTIRSVRSGRPALGLVAVDDPRASAQVAASLATSYTAEGKRVLIADLSAGGDAAGLLGVTATGTRPAGRRNTSGRLTVHRPVLADGPPLGRLPVRDEGVRLDRSLPDEEEDDEQHELAVAWAEADVVLTVAEVSPRLGADHLGTWCTDAVAVVTAGRSTATRIAGVGELVRRAGVRLGSAVLLRSDRTDETTGTVPA